MTQCYLKEWTAHAKNLAFVTAIDEANRIQLRWKFGDNSFGWWELSDVTRHFKLLTPLEVMAIKLGATCTVN